MDEARLRALVRDVVVRHLARSSGAVGASPDSSVQIRHSSHARFVALERPDDDQPMDCLIEPAVRCSHCGYCESLGH